MGKYEELKPSVRAYLESLSDQQVVNLVEMSDFYSNLEQETAQWLRRAQPEDIQLLREGTKLVNSGKTVARFLKWLLIGALGTFILATQLGDAVKKFLVTWRGILP